jgi:ketosteroid isomerase-like protein
MARGVLVVAILTGLGCRSGARTEAQLRVVREVRTVLDRQAQEWNAGNLAGFMETYWRSPHTRFQSGGDVSLGWQTVFDRYRKRYGDRAAMGRLDFSELEVTVLGSDAALASGRWRLQRAQDSPSGLFTLLLRHLGEGWRIVHDHTSTLAAEKR